MKITHNPEWMKDVDDSVLNGLSINNKRLVEGSTQVLINPAFEGVDDDTARGDLEVMLSSVHITDKLREIETSNSEKIGPRSLAKDWESRKKSLYDYFDHDDPSTELRLAHSTGALRPLSHDNASKFLITKSSSGLPYLTKKGNLRPYDILELISLEGRYPAMLYTRTAEMGKTRNVWGYPIADTLNENRFFQPFLARERQLSWRKVLNGEDAVDRVMTDVLRMAGELRKQIVCVDFTAFDSSVTPDQIRQAFLYIARAFQSDYHDELFEIARRTSSIGIMTPEGEISGEHGVPSGSTFTNTVDSIVQAQAVFGQTLDVGVGTFQVQGDDGVYIDDKEYIYESFEQSGFNINRDKSYVGDIDAVYLQRYYHPDYPSRDQRGFLGGVYSLHRAYTRLKYLESWTDFEKIGVPARDFYSLRAIMILENVKHHPCFEQFVEWVRSHDQYLLSYNHDSVTAYSETLRGKISAGAASAVNNKGLETFETVKYLRILDTR